MSEIFGKYELIRRIGVGGMAEIYVAHAFGAEGFVKDVVIKRILPAFNEDDDFVEMFVNEARIAARLQHTNIVQIFDFNHVDGAYYIAMEWVDGSDLRRIRTTAARRRMPIPTCLPIHVGVETLKGLHYAHTKREGGQPLNIVHRDISPHNILISFSSEVKITDFGIAKIAAVASATKTGALKGKLTYISPEQVRGERPDARSDIYSLGIVLWELSSEKRFYEGIETEGEILVAARDPKPRPLCDLNPAISPALSAVIDKMLQPRPDERYASAAQALADLAPHSNANDAFEITDYLRRLLPAEAEREERGQTQPMGTPMATVIPAAADAPTRTRTPSRGGATPSRSDVPIAGLAADSSAGSWNASASYRSAQGGQAALRHPEVAWHKRLRVVSFVAALLTLGLVGWAGGHYLLAPAALKKAAVPPSEHVDYTPVAIASQPSGAEVAIDGVGLGEKTPLVVYGKAGRKVRVEVKEGSSSQDTEVAFAPNAQARLELARPQAPSPPPSNDKQATAIPPAADKTATPKSVPAALKAAATEPPPKPEKTNLHNISTDPQTHAMHESAGRLHRSRPRASAGDGGLRIVVWPWAYVKIDGKTAGITPATAHVNAGKHIVELTNPELEKREVISVVVEPNTTLQLHREWSAR